MHETDDDLRALQELLDRSHAGAGEHLRAIFDDERRIPAAELPALLPGVQVLALATVTARGEPRVAPVDGLFFRGRWHFGSSERSARFRHIRTRPAVSAAHIRGEELAVIVHGRAVEIDPRGLAKDTSVHPPSMQPSADAAPAATSERDAAAQALTAAPGT